MVIPQDLVYIVSEFTSKTAEPVDLVWWIQDQLVAKTDYFCLQRCHFFLLILPEVRLHLPYSSDPDFSKLQGHLPLYPTPCWLG